MEKSAILHDMTQEYCFLNRQGEYVFRLRTKHNDMKQVNFRYRDKYEHYRRSKEMEMLEMEKVASDGITDYYEVALQANMISLRYVFEMEDTEGCKAYLGNFAFYNELPTDNFYMFDYPLKSKEEDRFLTPEWAKGKVVYQIFPDRFASSKKVSDRKWYTAPIKNPMAKFGGNLKGIIEKLDYIKGLGVDIIYMTPIFLADSNHKYDTTDYFQIDPEFGTKEDLQELVEKAHARDMYVVLDGVFNHTSTKFFAFRDLKKNKGKSQYKDWYYPEGFPLKAGPLQKPNYLTFGYIGWMPKLNTSNPQVQDYICKVVEYWTKECNIDGWRLDVGDEISHGFWKLFRKRMKAFKEDLLIIGEHWFLATAYLQGDEWDGLMNYHFTETVRSFVAYGTATAREFVNRMSYLKGRVHPEAKDVLWDLVDCHDTPRFLTLAKNSKKKQMLAAGIQLLSQSSPMIYYGDEVGMAGGNDPDCRRGMLWKDELQDKKMLAYYKKLLALRKTEPCIVNGESAYIFTDDENGLVVEERKLKDKTIRILYHNKKEAMVLPEYAGTYDLLAEKKFDGKISGYGLYVLQK